MTRVDDDDDEGRRGQEKTAPTIATTTHATTTVEDDGEEHVATIFLWRGFSSAQQSDRQTRVSARPTPGTARGKAINHSLSPEEAGPSITRSFTSRRRPRQHPTQGDLAHAERIIKAPILDLGRRRRLPPALPSV